MRAVAAALRRGPQVLGRRREREHREGIRAVRVDERGRTQVVGADESRETYKAVGAKIATFSELLGPKVVARGATASGKHGVRQGRTIGHPAQLGGAIVVRSDGSVAWSHMSQDASDIATPEEILAALKNA